MTTKPIKQEYLIIGGEKYLSESQAANYLGCSKSALTKQRERGTSPPYKIINKTRIVYKPADLVEWLEKHTVSVGGQ